MAAGIGLHQQQGGGHGLLLAEAHQGRAAAQGPLQLVRSLETQLDDHQTITQAAPQIPACPAWAAARAAPGEPGRERGKRSCMASVSWADTRAKASSSGCCSTWKGACRRE